MLRVIASVGALAALAHSQTAVNLTSSCTPNVVYTFNAGAIPATATSAAAGSANLRWAGTAGQDQLFESWWSYRLAGDNREFYFNRSATSGLQNPAAPIVVGPKGDRARIEWVNVDGRNFDARLTTTVYSTATAAAPNNGVASMCMEITNRTGQPMVLNLFHYADFDVCGSAGTDTATFVGPPRQIEITDAACPIRCYHLGCGWTNYQTAGFATVRSLLTNAVADNLNNTGIPFGPGDWTNAYQWQDFTIADGQTAAFYIGLACDRQIPCCDPATIQNYCVAKPGTNGIPRWGNNPLYVCGQSELKVENGFAGSAPFVVLGIPPGVCVPVPPFGTLAVLPIAASFMMPPFNANNVSALCLEVPWDVNLCGASLNFQAFFADPGAAGGIAHTDGCTFTIGSL
jgi:hypothetical protein